MLLLSSLQVSADGKPPIRRCSQISEIELFYPTDPGAAPTCERCLKCTRGQGLTPQCGSRVPNDTKIKCIQCQANVSYSNSSGIESCQPCQECGLKNVIQDCSPKKNRICGTECSKGYFLDDNHICQECYFCCDSVSEAQRRQGCKKIGMDRDWQCEKTTQNQRCYGDRKKVINGQEKHGAASLGPVMGGVVSIIFIISAFVLVASRKRIRESFSRTNNTVTAGKI